MYNDKIVEMKERKVVLINEDEIDEFENAEESIEIKINRKFKNPIMIKGMKLLRSAKIKSMSLKMKNILYPKLNHRLRKRLLRKPLLKLL
jgi:hypothetical protein